MLPRTATALRLPTAFPHGLPGHTEPQVRSQCRIELDSKHSRPETPQHATGPQSPTALSPTDSSRSSLPCLPPQGGKGSTATPCSLTASSSTQGQTASEHGGSIHF